MLDVAVETQIAQLREEAARYRRLADGPTPWHVAERLGRWADECDRQALRLIAGKWTAGKGDRSAR